MLIVRKFLQGVKGRRDRSWQMALLFSIGIAPGIAGCISSGMARLEAGEDVVEIIVGAAARQPRGRGARDERAQKQGPGVSRCDCSRPFKAV